MTLATLAAGTLVLLLVLRRHLRRADDDLRVSQAWLDAHHGGGRDE